MAEQNKSDHRRVRWVIPAVNPQRASLRYRCLYPMAELKKQGRSAAIWHDDEPIDDRLTLVFDAWTVFPTVNSSRVAEDLVALAEKAASLGATVIVDNCDNQFASANITPEWAQGLRYLERLARSAAVLVSCSDELAMAMQKNLRSNAIHVVIDDPIEQEIVLDGDTLMKRLFSPGRISAWILAIQHRLKIALDHARGRTSIIWFGSHGNNFAPGGMLDVLPLLPVLEAAAAHKNLSLTIVSNNRKKFDENFNDSALRIHYVDWNRITFLAILRMHQIAIIPAVPNEFTLCKSSNRLTLSTYHGLAVIADPIPSYRKYANVVALGDWAANLARLVGSRKAQHAQVAAARRQVLALNHLSVIAKQWDALFFAAPIAPSPAKP